MTGDGINDILALKEANCSIAMANGSEATRNVAQIVLMDSNFASMPKVVGEGRRVVNNIERASALFLTKTAFSILFQIILIHPFADLGSGVERSARIFAEYALPAVLRMG